MKWAEHVARTSFDRKSRLLGRLEHRLGADSVMDLKETV